MRPCHIVIALLVLAVAAPSGARVYKWVDDEGVTHYTQQPPPGGEAQVLNPDIGEPPAQGGPESSGAEDTENGTAQQEEEGEKTQSLADFCKQLRKQSQLLASDREVKIKRDADTLVSLEGEARQRRLNDVQSQIEQHCEDQGS